MLFYLSPSCLCGVWQEVKVNVSFVFHQKGNLLPMASLKIPLVVYSGYSGHSVCRRISNCLFLLLWRWQLHYLVFSQSPRLVAWCPLFLFSCLSISFSLSMPSTIVSSSLIYILFFLYFILGSPYRQMWRSLSLVRQWAQGRHFSLLPFISTISSFFLS